MSRRWTGRRRPSATVEQLEQALAASVDANRELRGEIETLEARATADQRQAVRQRDELTKSKAALAAMAIEAEQAARRISSLAEQLRRERKHTAGRCSHAADLRNMTQTVADLELRLHDLQQASMARDMPYADWEPEPEPEVELSARPALRELPPSRSVLKWGRG